MRSNEELTATNPRAGPNPIPVHHFRVLGVQLANASTEEAVDTIERLVIRGGAGTKPIYIANAHTLNLAAESTQYRDVLNSAHLVFADGTGARWAARMRGIRLKANLVGTDLVPQLFERTAGRGYRYFMLGADAATIAVAAETAARQYPGWTLRGFHHGYVQEAAAAAAVIEQINAAKPDVLLVGMGNPLQEAWIHQHRAHLHAAVSIGVGGLFDHWGGNLKRAPAWVRRQGCEWVQLLVQQPHKWRRYLLGNPRFLVRVSRTALAERASNRNEQ
jgi:N-acetylglucosaminyldiphosphoundecaprenol N-acetyl-beta-D-mannosaminyltransferase